LVRSFRAIAQPPSSVRLARFEFTSEVLAGLLRIGFVNHQQIIWDKGRTVLTRTHYWFQHEPCWYVRKKNAPWFGKAGENSTVWQVPSPKFIMGGSKEEKCDHPTQKPLELMRLPILNHTKRAEWECCKNDGRPESFQVAFRVLHSAPSPRSSLMNRINPSTSPLSNHLTWPFRIRPRLY
jgi:hypothetical protein